MIGLNPSFIKEYNMQLSITLTRTLSHILWSDAGFVLGLLLFLIFINDLLDSVKSSTVYHFADDTNLLYANKSLKKINKLVNHNIVLIAKWLRANNISPNTSKTEIILFCPKRKTISKRLNFRISKQKLNISKNVKYLGITLIFVCTSNSYAFYEP